MTAPEATDPTEPTANLTGWYRIDALATDPIPGVDGSQPKPARRGRAVADSPQA